MSLHHIIIPCIVVPICVGLFLLIFYGYRQCRLTKQKQTKPPIMGKHCPRLELKKNLIKETTIKIPEFPISSIRFLDDLGGGTFGNVYTGELTINVHNLPIRVAIKTLRRNSENRKRIKFALEMERSCNLKHVNVLCMIGVCRREKELECLIYEYSVYGDLHEYLTMHSPHSDITSRDRSGRKCILQNSDMLLISVQIAAGMDYISSHDVIHGDLAARNVLVADNTTMKISDLGVSREAYANEYHSLSVGVHGERRNASLPVRWMPAEAITYGQPSGYADVWSFGVTLWEIYTYGLQPYYGCSNAEAIERIRSHDILPSPFNCPSAIYSVIVECWNQTPSSRPKFGELYKRLRQWLPFNHFDSLEGSGLRPFEEIHTNYNSRDNTAVTSLQNKLTCPTNNPANTQMLFRANQTPKSDQLYPTNQRVRTKPPYLRSSSSSNQNQNDAELEFCDENINTIRVNHQVQLSDVSGQRSNPSSGENDDNFNTNAHLCQVALDTTTNGRELNKTNLYHTINALSVTANSNI